MCVSYCCRSVVEKGYETWKARREEGGEEVKGIHCGGGGSGGGGGGGGG